jgi:hypothetical protein
MMVKPWQEQHTAAAQAVTATGASAVSVTMGISGAAVQAGGPNGHEVTMTASQYVAALSRDFRALPDAPDDDSSVDFDPDL